MSGDEINLIALTISKTLTRECNKKELEDIVFILKQIISTLMPYIIYDKK